MKTIKRYYFLTAFILLFISQNNCVAASKLSDRSEISLLTCVQGDELYSIFGHSAIRVKDPIQRIDYVYNYGTFNFAEPNFYVKFVKGKLNYRLAKSTFLSFIQEYIDENRTVTEQILDLKIEEKQQIFDFLETNYLPENRYYLYDFFFDNCATRIRDVFQTVFKNKLIFDDSVSEKNLNFRDLIGLYLVNKPWSHLGLNTLLGQPTDRRANPPEYMFLPDFLKDAFGNASIVREGELIFLVGKERIVYEAKEKESKRHFQITPTLSFLVILLLGILLSYLEYRIKKHYRFVDAVLFTVSGFMGIFLLLLWFATDHKPAAMNWNIWWAIPMHFIFGILLFRKKMSKITSSYFLIAGIITFLLIPFWYFIPQEIDFRLFPFVILLGLRSLMIYSKKFRV
jgi:uncharacterized membrane protein